MASNSGAQLRVRVSADLADIKQGLGLLRGELAQVRKQAERATPSTAPWVAGLKQVRNQLVGLISVYGALRAVRTYTELADQAANLSARLKLVTRDQREFESAYRGTFAIAQRTSAEWESVVGLYGRIAQSTALGQREILSLTETISQAFQVSGAGPQDTANGIRQLTQAIAGGILRAEEFNSIIETSPRIVQALADHFGIAFGQVRKHVNDGKVTTNDLVSALQKGAQGIRDEFGKLPLTVSRATQQVRTALLALVGDADNASGASRDLAGAIASLAQTLQDPATISAFQSFITLLAKLAGAGVKAANWVSRMTEVARIAGGSLTVDKASDDALRERLDQLQANIDAGREWRKEQGNIAERLTGGRDFRAYDAMVDEARRIQSILEIRENGSSSPGNGRRPRPDEPAGTANPAVATDTTKRIAQSNALLRDSIARALSELERLYEANEVGMRDYFAKRQALQEEAINAEIAQARAELAVTKELEPRRKLEEDIVRLQRDRAELGTKTAYEQKAAEEALSKQLGEVKIQLLELDGETGRAARARLYAEYQDLFERLKADSDVTGEAMVNNLIDRLVARSSLDQLRERIGKATGALQADESSISAQASAGLLGPLEAERQLQAARQTTLDLLRKAREETLAFLATLDPRGTEAAEARLTLQGLNTDIANIIASQQQMRQDIEGAGVQALQNFFGNIREGSMGAGEMLRALAGDFSRMVFDILAQAGSKKVVSAISSLFGGGSKGGDMAAAGATAALALQGGATTASTTLTTAGTALATTLVAGAAQAALLLRSASTFGSFAAAHGGGVAGRLQMLRNNISPMVFGAAPRYHGGGIAGLANDEIPAILQRGETIRTQQQEAALSAQLDAARTGGGRGMVTTPIVAIGDNAVADAMASAAGTQVILTVVRENWEGLSRGGKL